MTMNEKRKGGIIDGVALSKGEGKYAPYIQKKSKPYAGQARAQAAKNMRKGS